MQLNDIFGLDKYDEAYKFVSENKGTTIQDIGNKKYQIVELPKPSLEELKLAKREEINQARDKSEQGGFEYMGKVFDSDQVSAQRISMAAQAMALATEGTTITWTCQDNSTIDLTATDMQGLVSALAVWSNSCHEKATALKSQIDAAKTAEELEKITWDDKPATLL